MLLCADLCFAQSGAVPISKADSLMNKQAKPLLILISTGWCKYCEMQKALLREDTGFIKKANQFYYIEFDAESRENVYLNGREYLFRQATGLNELAEALNGHGQITFPTWIVLNKHYELLFRFNGMLTLKQMNRLLTLIEVVQEK